MQDFKLDFPTPGSLTLFFLAKRTESFHLRSVEYARSESRYPEALSTAPTACC